MNEDSGGLSTRAKAFVGALIGVLYAVGMSVRGDVLPGVVGGILAGILCFLVLREVERQRAARTPTGDYDPFRRAVARVGNLDPRSGR